MLHPVPVSGSDVLNPQHNSRVLPQVTLRQEGVIDSAGIQLGGGYGVGQRQKQKYTKEHI